MRALVLVLKSNGKPPLKQRIHLIKRPYPRNSCARHPDARARAELLPRLECGAALRALGAHVLAAVLVDVAEGRVQRDQREVDVAEGGVLEEGRRLGQGVGPARDADGHLVVAEEDVALHAAVERRSHRHVVDLDQVGVD